MRILYIAGTWVPPDVNRARDRFYLLSGHLEGDVLQPVWWSTTDEVVRRFGEGTYPAYTSGDFRYHWCLSTSASSRMNRLRQAVFYLRRGLRIHREKPVDCIVVYSHQTTGLCGVILKLLTGAKLVIEIMTSPRNVHLAEKPKPGLRERLMFLYSEFCLHISVRLADRVHLLAPNLLSSYRLLRNRPKSVFHDFVTVASVPPAETASAGRGAAGDPYILLVGAPWYLKGADLLVTAVKALAKDYPRVRLRLLGHYPDRAGLDALIDGDERIEVLKAVLNPEALKLIAGAYVLALPSRCEGLPRVLIEAMAAGVPVVGSDVGGIPHIVRDGENGFVFPTGDARALEERLRTLLADPELAARMGNRGREIARQEFNEDRWVEHFTAMVEDAVRGNP